MKAAGEQVRLTWDGHDPIEPGDYLRTATTGRTYLIAAVRVQTRGKWAGRSHLTAEVMPGDHVTEPDAVVHTIQWYPRG